MAILERTYNIPLRKEFLKVPRYKRAKKSIAAIREFLARHMKAETILIGSYLNKKVWERGIKNPPHHVKVTAVKDEKGTVTAELIGAPKPLPKEAKEEKEKKMEKQEQKKEQLKKEAGELEEALAGELKKAGQEAETETQKAAGQEPAPAAEMAAKPAAEKAKASKPRKKAEAAAEK